MLARGLKVLPDDTYTLAVAMPFSCQLSLHACCLFVRHTRDNQHGRQIRELFRPLSTG